MTSAQTEKASSRLRRAGRARAASTARRAAAYTVLGLLCFLCLFFFYILLINATRTHFEIQRGFSLLPGRSLLTNLKSVLANANIPVLSGIRNSLLVSALSALLSVYFSALTAYGIHAYDFKFKKLAFTFILLIMMMPTQVSALGFVRLITKMGMADTLAPLFLPSIAAPVVFYFMLQYMEGNLPMEIVEAARIDGSGEFSTFNRIVLPILKPALAVQAIFTFVNTWNNYFTPALVLSSSGKKTLPILIAQLRSADFLKFDMGQVYMMVAIAILPVIVVYLLLSKFIVAGVAATIFLGGWMPLHIAGWEGFNAVMDCIPGFVWFFAKAFFVVWLLMWIKWTFPRLRIDQILTLEWKYLVPIGLANLLLMVIVVVFKLHF